MSQQLDLIRDLHSEALAADRIGLPLSIGIQATGKNLADRLGQMEMQLRQRSVNDNDLASIVSADPELPEKYRLAVRTWLRCDSPVEVLESLSVATTSQRAIDASLHRAAFGPLVILTFVYFGFITLCNFALPRIEMIYAQTWQTPSIYVRLLAYLRDYMPIWVPGVPIAIVILIVFRQLRPSRPLLSWLVGSGRYCTHVSASAYARLAAALVDSGSTIDEALSMVGPFLEGRRLPPRLRWALRGEFDRDQSPDVLRQVARMYQTVAARRIRIWSTWLPILVSAVLGGAMVLAYGLSLFLPYIELLRYFADSH